eukprot:GHVL01027353.1.p1 GENE.GHVL01027353.1~~GHVL01027353.1.p1  ORF type:complete len:507 (+),score=117.71 GHVL01027353.1:1401-2921(+)
MLINIPKNYEKYQNYTKNGLRVISLGIKIINETDVTRNREYFEKDIYFVGFMILRSCLKSKTKHYLQNLKNSMYELMMITGDNPLTACQVAKDVSILELPFAISTIKDDMLEWNISSPDLAPPPPVKISNFKFEDMKDISEKYGVCVTGPVYKCLSPSLQMSITPLVQVFARVSPQQKEEVIKFLNISKYTLMCGDGTNDVGALKVANIGVSILSDIKKDKKKEIKNDKNNVAQRLQKWNEAQQKLAEGSTMVELGDASVASPFTYKGDSVKCVFTILRLGRATLATVYQMYKLLSVTSLMSAFALSVLTLDGVKMGDFQTTVTTLYITVLQLLLSKSSPSKILSSERPVTSVFAPSVILSIVWQTTVHLSCVTTGWLLCRQQRPPDWLPNIDGDFSPDLTNTVVFYLVASMNISSFIANYEGPPFIAPLSENKLLQNGLIFYIICLLIFVAEIFPDFNIALELVLAPTFSLRLIFVALVLIDMIFSISGARLIQYLFLKSQKINK